MNSFSKLTSSVLLLSSVFFIGCDSATPLGFGGVALTDITPSDENVEAGEIFDFEDVLNPGSDQFLDTIRMSGNNFGAIGDVIYNYTSTGEYTSSLTAEAPVEEALTEAVREIFNISNASNTEVRSLLLVTNNTQDAPIMTVDETARLIELLNVNGAGLVANPSDLNQILVVPNRVYSMTNRSTQAERVSGIVGGRYAMEASSLVVGYTITDFTDGEDNIFQYYLPTLTNTLLPTQVFERGTFTLQLVNEIGF